MEDAAISFCLLLLALWWYISRENNQRLEAARKNTAEKRRRVVDAINYEQEEKRRRRNINKRRKRMLLHFERQPQRPSVWSFDRATQWWDITVSGFTNAQWLQNFRMSDETFTFLCSKLRPAMERQNSTFRDCVPLRKRVAIALWKLATGSEYRSIGHLFGVSITTVCRCVQDFCASAATLLVPEQICFPDPERFKNMSTFIDNRWGLPQCVGAVDGSHIPIIAPQEYHTDYFNRKGWHSINLQGVVDGKGLFWHVFAGMPGSMHDARVLRLSSLWELASQGMLFPDHTREVSGVMTGYYILGDSAYPLQKWLLKPYSDTGRLTADQQLYNKKFSRARVVVENAFGRLKGRWRCLLKRNDSDLELVKSMVLACCALHNLCESHGETYDSAWTEPAVPVVGTAAQGAEDEGRHVRDAVMRHFLSHS
ncbi:hypothetical protein WMY93_033497 [Mugilogobius chulae]|uniref:DDE Tnp4 domain-containing protein n=1 Tax=Mugilogobius chulae TaxID=88201 RepID=A0AAW0MSQ3_9GOBI